MWLHIRGVGEWTNRLYTYFEKEQARLHNGEIPPLVIGSSVKPNVLPLRSPELSSTPQKDFLAKNLTQINHNAPMLNSSFVTANSLAYENEIAKKQNPFDFNVNSDNKEPARPPRQAAQKTPSTDSCKTPTNLIPRKVERQTSENSSTIKKIQATLQRTFSRKGSSGHEGYTNDGFSGDSTDSEYKVRVSLDNNFFFFFFVYL